MCEDHEPRARTQRYPTRKRVLHHLVKRGVIAPRSRQAEALRIILTLPPRYLGVTAIAAVVSISRRPCTRLFGSADLPSPQARRSSFEGNDGVTVPNVEIVAREVLIVGDLQPKTNAVA